MAGSRSSESSVRRQVITPRRSRRIDRVRSRRGPRLNLTAWLNSAAALAKPAVAIVFIVGLIVAYNALINSQLFDLRRVTVLGTTSSLQDEVEQAVRRAVQQSKLTAVSLTAVRQKVEALPRVRMAWVARVLPDEIRVEVVERQPVLPVRRQSGAIVWLDADGVELGEVSGFKASDMGEIPPIAIGFSEGNRSAAAVADDKERIALYKEIEREFTQGQSIWNLVDEINLTYIKERDVSIHLARPAVNIHVGSRDFRNRFETALKILDAIRRNDPEMLSRYRLQDPERLIKNRDRIDFVDAARPDRIVLNFSGPSPEGAMRQEPRAKIKPAANRARASKAPGKKK
jgi:hypothetical protein